MPGMFTEVYKFYGRADSFQYGFFQGSGPAGGRYHHAVMIWVATIIKQPDAFPCPEGAGYLFYLFKVSPLTEVGDAFHNYILLVHASYIYK
jgi:hypothetical protein